MDSSNINTKNLFKYIMKYKYNIIKDPNIYDILTIRYDNKELKCKYLILFTLYKKQVMWADVNLYNDKKNKEIVTWLKNYISDNEELNVELNVETMSGKKIKKTVKKIIDSNKELSRSFDTNALCVITENYKEYKQFYLITELINF